MLTINEGLIRSISQSPKKIEVFLRVLNEMCGLMAQSFVLGSNQKLELVEIGRLDEDYLLKVGVFLARQDQGRNLKKSHRGANRGGGTRGRGKKGKRQGGKGDRGASIGRSSRQVKSKRG